MNNKPSQGDILIYKNEKGDTKVDVYYIDDTVWMTQKQIATLYDKTVPAINMHIRNILADEELAEKINFPVLRDSSIRWHTCYIQKNKKT